MTVLAWIDQRWTRWRRRRVLRRNASGYRAALRGLLELAADG